MVIDGLLVMEEMCCGWEWMGDEIWWMHNGLGLGFMMGYGTEFLLFGLLFYNGCTLFDR